MGTTLTIALRYLTARREGAGLSLVPLLSGLGIMIGVATLVVVMAGLERQAVTEEPVILVVEEDQDTLMDLSPW